MQIPWPTAQPSNSGGSTWGLTLRIFTSTPGDSEASGPQIRPLEKAPQ